MRFLASNKYVYAFSKKKTKTKNKYLKVLDYFEKNSFFLFPKTCVYCNIFNKILHLFEDH